MIIMQLGQPQPGFANQSDASWKQLNIGYHGYMWHILDVDDVSSSLI